VRERERERETLEPNLRPLNSIPNYLARAGYCDYREYDERRRKDGVCEGEAWIGEGGAARGCRGGDEDEEEEVEEGEGREDTRQRKREESSN
jgi:hypothetical protein